MALSAQGLLGIALIPLLAWLLSSQRSQLPLPQRLRLVGITLALQIAIALVLLKMPWTRTLFDAIGQGVAALEHATDAGMQMVFGYLAGGPAPFEIKVPQHAFLLAFRGLPLILVLSALVQLLYYWGVLQRMVTVLALALRKALGTGGPLATIASSSIFLGLVEAPLLVRPYIRSMSKPALFAAMVVTMSTIAGTVLALYASILGSAISGAAGHLLAGSIMNVPGALMLARLMMPETDPNAAHASAEIHLENAPQSSMDAIAMGTIEGVKLLSAVIAMLVVMVSLVALANSLIGTILSPFGWTITLQKLLGYACAPIAWLIGIPMSEAATAGSLLGQKLVLNELLAYLDLARIPEGELSPRSRVIITYALCSFANLGSLGIQVGALTAMAPERRAEIVSLAPRAMLLGFMATLLSAAIIGLIV